jgi:hypothetical protein
MLDLLGAIQIFFFNAGDTPIYSLFADEGKGYSQICIDSYSLRPGIKAADNST